jgi:hypothetical protein
MHNAEQHRRQKYMSATAATFAAMILAAAFTSPTKACAATSDFSRFVERSTQPAPVPFVEDATNAQHPTPASIADANELRLRNNAHPTATAPLPPAVLSGSGVLLAHWALRKMYKRRWI